MRTRGSSPDGVTGVAQIQKEFETRFASLVAEYEAMVRVRVRLRLRLRLRVRVRVKRSLRVSQ